MSVRTFVAVLQPWSFNIFSDFLHEVVSPYDLDDHQKIFGLNFFDPQNGQKWSKFACVEKMVFWVVFGTFFQPAYVLCPCFVVWIIFSSWVNKLISNSENNFLSVLYFFFFYIKINFFNIFTKPLLQKAEAEVLIHHTVLMLNMRFRWFFVMVTIAIFSKRHYNFSLLVSRMSLDSGRNL